MGRFNGKYCNTFFLYLLGFPFYLIFIYFFMFSKKYNIPFATKFHKKHKKT